MEAPVCLEKRETKPWFLLKIGEDIMEIFPGTMVEAWWNPSCHGPPATRRKGLLLLRGRAESLRHPGHRRADSAGKSSAGGADAGGFSSRGPGVDDGGCGFGWLEASTYEK